MSPMAFPWTALMAMQPQRSHQVAWFVYGWVEREHILNVRACADWWMQAMGLSAAPCMAARQRYREHDSAGRATGLGPRE